jgi:hypothetical protein
MGTFVLVFQSGLMPSLLPNVPLPKLARPLFEPEALASHVKVGLPVGRPTDTEPPLPENTS